MSGSVTIALADVNTQVRNKRTLYKWIMEVVASERKELDRIAIILCSDDFLLEMNKKFLDHHYYTDIITFDYCEGKVIAGELYISVDRVRENAQSFGVKFSVELYRVMIHGVLHLCGYGDKTDKERALMRRKENTKLKLLVL